jgi:hypothetical protein
MISSNNWITPLIMRAGRAVIAAKGKDPAIEGEELARWLRSAADIGPAEREMLAELVTGVWRARKGARNRPGPGMSTAIALVADFEERLASYGARRVLLAKGDTAALFGESVCTVERYHSDAKERREALDRAKSRLDR